jgi:hypothetical protein
MKKTYQGSCHCGKVRYECEVDLERGTSRCNCSVCTKSRFWKAIVPAADFRITSGEDCLSIYRFGSNMIRHSFCSECGVKPFGRGELESIGPFFAVNIATLDGVSPEELAKLPVTYEDGRHDAWQNAPAVTRYL